MIPLLDKASLALDSSGDDISLLGDRKYLLGNDVYPTEEVSLGASITTGHTSASRVKKDTSLLTQYFNATLKKEREPNASALEEAETLKFRMVENKITLMTKKITEPVTGDGDQGP